MNQPDVTGAAGPAGTPAPRADTTDGAAGSAPGTDAAEPAPGPDAAEPPGAGTAAGTGRPAGAARIRPPADLPARLRRAAIVFPFLILFVVLSVASWPSGSSPDS